MCRAQQKDFGKFNENIFSLNTHDNVDDNFDSDDNNDVDAL